MSDEDCGQAERHSDRRRAQTCPPPRYPLPGLIEVDVVRETEQVLALRPPIQGFGTDHVIVVPKRHVRSLLELKPGLGAHLLQIVQEVSRDVIDEHGGCQVLTTLGDEQHNRHLHVHVAVGEGLAPYVTRQVEDRYFHAGSPRPAR
ncbi:HIT family protein [Nocardia sp. NPDC051900]|uniref:HIT family protein n=1 Tax=Nocardia sp. NPDC051900 TaxID=3364326 RepID=UPI0037AF04A7